MFLGALVFQLDNEAASTLVNSEFLPLVWHLVSISIKSLVWFSYVIRCSTEDLYPVVR